MVGIDSNVLIRYLTNDDPKQAASAQAMLRNCTANNPAYINLVVLVETIWVLRRFFDFSREGILDLLDKLLSLDQVRFQERRSVDEALRIAEKSGCDFPDALISVLNLNSGCESTLTFDHKASSIKGMQAL